MQRDPAKEGVNWYGYVGENPLTHIDPTGRTEEENPYPCKTWEETPDNDEFKLVICLECCTKKFPECVFKKNACKPWKWPACWAWWNTCRDTCYTTNGAHGPDIPMP